MDIQENYNIRLQEQAALQQELFARVFTHKTAIVGGVLMREYISKQESMGGVQLPEAILQQQAQEYVQNTLAQAMATGTLNSLYEEIWERVKETLPDETNVMIHEEAGK